VSTLRSKAAPLSSSLRSLPSWAPSPIPWPRDARGLRGERRGGWSGRISLGVAAAFSSDWGFWRFLAKCKLKAQFFPTVVAGLNNQQGGEKLLF
jgi:hypothetical protein